jgi:hypothetical protein
MKSLLLGSAAALVVAASAQAADLPTKKGALAVEYVRICHINGVAGFVIPGSDTCLKISGGIEAMAAFGNLDNQYVPTADPHTISWVHIPPGHHWGIVHSDSWTTYPFKESDSKYRDATGFDARADIGLETVSNTPYGPLTGVIDIHWDFGAGMGVAGVDPSYINQAYIQWAGITAGIKPSFYDFIAGGETWFNLISPEHSGTGVPLFAYTASFGGGMSATISLEQNTNYCSGREAECVGPETFYHYGPMTILGERAPDIVGSLDLTQGWGMGHAAFVAHNYRLEDLSGNDVDGWGWGGLLGVGFNIPQVGAGDVVKLQGAYSHAAIGYSGFNTSGWDQGSNGLNINGNGQIYTLGDAIGDNLGDWSYPTTWEVAAVAELHLTPQFEVAPEISYGNISWDNRHLFGPFGHLEGDAWSWLGGAAFTWTPVTNLSFNLDLVYQYSHWDAPTDYGHGFVASSYPPGHADGFNGRIRVERDF